MRKVREAMERAKAGLTAKREERDRHPHRKAQRPARKEEHSSSPQGRSRGRTRRPRHGEALSRGSGRRRGFIFEYLCVYLYKN